MGLGQLKRSLAVRVGLAALCLVGGGLKLLGWGTAPLQAAGLPRAVVIALGAAQLLAAVGLMGPRPRWSAGMVLTIGLIGTAALLAPHPGTAAASLLVPALAVGILLRPGEGGFALRRGGAGGPTGRAEAEAVEVALGPLHIVTTGKKARVLRPVEAGPPPGAEWGAGLRASLDSEEPEPR